MVVPTQGWNARAGSRHHVHDVSSSGATLLEPRELVDPDNSIKVWIWTSSVRCRILRELSALVAPHQPALAGTVGVLGRLDGISAKAALSLRLQASHTSQRSGVRAAQAGASPVPGADERAGGAQRPGV